ncbi:MAG: type III pantothenate kinase [Candidatus Kryptonium sp.]|nr:type III pantothenate kinase [Candidatus Kryptonium sp.]MCX7761667.1 type III pantothenate kinase [Candidatus Kryptonium sp.]MDW8108085.1 type III pantothenate kinase [Candidatus Kryptonium sp.]
MLLAIDIGNTHTVFGIYKDGELLHDWRVSSLITRTEDETWLLVKFFCNDANVNIEEITGVGISSVVPNLTDVFVWMSQKHFKTDPVIVSSDLDLGIKILYDDPSAVGADRLCNAVAGYTKYGGPVIIVDFGTATTYDVVSENGEYLGGVIAPGIETSAAELHRRAAKLPKIELHFPKSVIGTNTVSSMQSGIMYGAVDAMEGMIKRIKNIIGQHAKVIATGGLAKAIIEKTNVIDFYEPSLVLDGIYIIYNRVKNKVFSP